MSSPESSAYENTEAAPHGGPRRTEWPLFEIFIRGQHGLSHRHVGSLHAPDAERAMQNARDVYTRRKEGSASGS